MTLSGRVAVVTGASRGIGRAAALEFAKRGAHVLALARTVGGLEELDDEIRAAGGSATLVPVDLRDFDAHDRLGKSIFDRWKKLDILLLNGAVLGPVTPIPHIAPKDFAEALDVNVTANYRLLRSLDPLLKQSSAGRVIAVSSAAAHRAVAYVAPYCVTKAAFEMMMRIYAAECENTNIRVSVVDPGAVRTKMRATFMPGEDPMTLPAPRELAPMFAELASPAYSRNGETIRFTDWRQ